MAPDPKQSAKAAVAAEKLPEALVEKIPLWQLDIVEVTGHNLEARGREDVNALLVAGWRLLLIYTLKFHEDNVWRERPMAILGRPGIVQNLFDVK